MKLTIFALAFLLQCGDGVKDCSCFPSHPQQLFCNSDFVIRAMVTSKNFPFSKKSFLRTTYTLTILHVYRGKEAIFSLLDAQEQGREILPSLKFAQVNVTTPLRENECGVKMEIAKSYLVMGNIHYGKMGINSCDFVTEWPEVKNQVKRGIHGDYDCRCNVETRMTTFDADVTNRVIQDTNTTCYWEMHPAQQVDDCALNYLTCRKLVNPVVVNHQSETCVWIEGIEYEECQTPP